MRTRLAATALVALLPLGAALAQAPREPSKPPGAVEAVAAAIAVERELLREDLERLKRLGAGRDAALEREREALLAIDALTSRPEALTPESIERARAALLAAETERGRAIDAQLALLERVLERGRRVSLLEGRLADLTERAGEAAGPLSASWDVAFMPSGQKGRFALSQSGTLVTGTYSLDGGWTGSLQGTLVNRKVYLERIDARVGRWGSLEGYLASDGRTIRGTWSRLELAGQDGAEGQWIATRAAP